MTQRTFGEEPLAGLLALAEVGREGEAGLEGDDALLARDGELVPGAGLALGVHHRGDHDEHVVELGADPLGRKGLVLALAENDHHHVVAQMSLPFDLFKAQNEKCISAHSRAHAGGQMRR